MIDRRHAYVIMVALILTGFPPILQSQADFVPTPSHNSGSYTLTDRGFVCHICHIGLPSAATYAEESMGVVENYRCLACHASLSRTNPHFRALASSPHSSLGCLFCHWAYHVGHQKYGSAPGRVYGCFGGRCHQIVTQDYTLPPGATVNFLNTYVVRVTSTSSFNITRYLHFYTADPTRAGRGTYAMIFGDPYNALRSYPVHLYPSGKRFWTCLHCHFTRLGYNETGVRTTYWLKHPDRCYDCHSVVVGLTGHSVAVASYAWDRCGSCHTGIADSIKGTVHANLGCRCHNVVHISRYNSSASWLKIYHPPPGIYITPVTVDFATWARRFYYERPNGTALGVPVHSLLVDTDIRYITVAYVLRDANASRSAEFKWLICYNCHIIVSSGSVAVDSLGRIPIPAITLDIGDPHLIKPLRTYTTSRNLEEVGGVAQRIPLIITLLVSLIIVAIMLRVIKQFRESTS